MKKIKVYTLEYQPFIMGGNVWQPVATHVEASGPHSLGPNYKGFVITAPNGKTFVAEARSGAFVGPNLKTVRDDLRIGDPTLMKKQVDDALIQCEQARVVEPDEFWKLLKCDK